MLPFSHVLKNLWRLRARTALTVLGVGTVTLLVVLLSGFAIGLSTTTEDSADPDVVVVTGSTGEHDLVRSVIRLDAARAVAINLPGVLEVGGERAVSPELHVATRRGNRIGLLRGVEAGAFLVHPRVVVVEGVEPRGPHEILAGRLAESRMGLEDGALGVGRTVELEGRPWTIVGRFAAPGTVLEAEMWGRLADVMDATRRTDVSCVAARLADADLLEDVRAWIVRHGVTYEISAVPESELLDALQSALDPIAALAWAMAGLVLVGGVFACTNTMFAAVLARTREMGTLRALGFSPAAVALSLLQESLLIGLLGGLLGTLVAGLFGEITLKFPMGAFPLDLSATVRYVGLGAALLIGLLGGIVPAWRAVRLPLPDALGAKL
jgi:ABC-type lipoprotein release transport system permease subunit